MFEIITENLTPWNIVVYSGHCHWDKPIENIQTTFYKEKEAQETAKLIKQYHPEYCIEIYYQPHNKIEKWYFY